jgi:acyl-CoA thioesterase
MINDKDQLARAVVEQMMKDDLFSQWLGIEVIEIKEGCSKIKMTVRKEMINGLGVVQEELLFH